jgi:hypothetical protein
MFPIQSFQPNNPTIPGVFGQVFFSSGTFTIPTGVTALKITLVGGGGNGGNNNGASGAGGGLAVSYLTGLTPANTIAVTVGAAAGLSRIASGTQTITTVTANGGTSGNSGYPPNSSVAGGTATNGTINLTGQSVGGPSNGGSPFFGFGFGGNRGGCCTAGSAGLGYGAGGGAGGGGCSGGAGAAGRQGIVIFEW